MKFIIKRFIITLLFFSAISIIAEIRPAELNVFEKRRLKFIEKMENGIAVFGGNNSVSYSGEAEYSFRQNADFYYLTGYDKPGAALILIKGDDNKSILFITKTSFYSEVYDGIEKSIEEIKTFYCFDEVYYKEDFDEVFDKLSKNITKIYYSFSDNEINKKINSLFDLSYRKPEEVINSEIITKELRVIKSCEEIELIQKAVDITNKAHLTALEKTKPGINEYELQALIEYTFRINGSPRNGFPSIVGSGKNSCVLHYQKNNRVIEDSVTVVLDIGAEYGNYSADVTRTIPSSGKFTHSQKEIYGIVFQAHKQAIEMIKPGVNIREVHNKTFEVIAEGLLNLGLITDVSKKWQTKIWYPHGSSHWLGLDTHDAGDYNYKEGGRILEPGMVFTVEPGIYIAENILNLSDKMPAGVIPKDEFIKFKDEIKKALEKYKNIGVRIEDDILVTENGYKNLSRSAPHTIEEIEKIMNK